MIASTVLVLTAGRLSDLFGRKRAYVGGFVVFAARLARRRLRRRRHRADPLAHPPGHRRRLPVRQRRPRWSPTRSPRAARLAMGTNTMVAAVGLVLGPVLGGGLVEHLLALGLLVQRAARPGRRGSGAHWCCASCRGATRCAGSTCSAPSPSSPGLTGLVLGISRGGLSGWDDPLVIVGAGRRGRAAAAVRADREPRPRADARPLDLRNRLFAAATGAAFINGLSRFALMFVFVFYFQGAQGDDPITAGIKLAPLAIGMLISSPLAGIWADRHGSRMLAAAGMLVSAAGLAGDDHAPGRAAPTGRARSGCCSWASGRACSTRPTPPR